MSSAPDAVDTAAPPPRRGLSRRQALGLAVGGVAGAAGISAGVLRLTATTTAKPGVGPSLAGPSGAWPSPLGDSRALAAHLLRRAGFGYDQAELDAAAKLSYDDLVDKLVSQQPESPPALPVAEQVNHRAVSRWWYAHMATTTAQFPERMLLFWHGHFTSDYRKAGRLPFVHQQNVLYRRLGTTDLRSLLLGVVHDPLMMRYLDLSTSTAAAPNENFAREVMELFTLGVGHYGEQDVREAARALSGLRVALVDAAGDARPLPARKGQTPQHYLQELGTLLDGGAHFEGRLLPRLHDGGEKTLLGRKGNLGPEEVVDTLLAQDACAPFVTTKVLTAFCTPTPGRDLVQGIAAQFRASKYDLRTLMRAVFRSDDFQAAAAYRALVRSPADYMVATMRATAQSSLAPRCVVAGAGMDQVLYDPPNVAGWPQGAGWVSSSAWLSRLNFAQTAVTAAPSLPDSRAALQAQLDGVLGDDTTRVLAKAGTEPDRWYTLLAGPEFALK
jgi:uncharacterized protein (DUF1800 family)